MTESTMLQELRAWLEKLTRLHLRNAEERVISDYEAGEHQRTLATLVRIDELERQHAERARAGSAGVYYRGYIPDWTADEWDFARQVVEGHRKGLAQIEAGQTTTLEQLRAQARAERVAEAKRAIIWAGMFIECLPDGSTQFDPQKMAEAYVASQEAAE